MLGRLLRSSRTLCHCEEQLEDPKHYYLYEPLHAFPGKLNVSMVDSIYGDMTQCNISPIFPQLKADTMNSRVINSWLVFFKVSHKIIKISMNHDDRKFRLEVDANVENCFLRAETKKSNYLNEVLSSSFIIILVLFVSL